MDLAPADTVYVGRALDCAVRTDDGMVSRRHSQIRFEGGRFVVEDLGSANGTLLNNVRVQKHALAHNDLVQCGSLVIRYVEDSASGPSAAAAAPAPQVGKRGTMLLNKPAPPANLGTDPVGGASPSAAPVPGRVLPFGGPPDIPNVEAGGPRRSHQVSVLPFGGPPELPDLARQTRETVQPAMPGPSVEAGVVERMEKELREAKLEIERVNGAYEREVADAKRLRAEATALRERLEEMRANVRDREAQVAAHDRVAEELRDELEQMRQELLRVRSDLTLSAETLLNKERALGRLQDETTKLRDEIEAQGKQLADVIRNKDDGWKRLNSQLGEIEQLREVINAQERMIEERRIGLISQEEVIKELRGDRERLLKQAAQARAERDEGVAAAARAAAQVSAVDEENRRLSRMLAEAQMDRGKGSVGSDQTLHLAGELKDLRVELRRVEADRDRAIEMHQRDREAASRLEGRVATLEVDLQEATHARLTAESARSVAQEALAKAEVARHKAKEELLRLAQSSEHAGLGADETKRELERSKRRVAELETAAAATAGKPSQIEQYERQLRTLQTELNVARIELAKAASARALPPQERTAVELTRHPALTAKIQEVYDGINDVLSQLRGNAVIVHGELPKLAGDAHVTQLLRETVEALLDNAETAKGTLRGLKEVAEIS